MPGPGMNHDMPNPYVAPGLHNNISPGAMNTYRGPMVSFHSLWEESHKVKNIFLGGVFSLTVIFKKVHKS